MHFSVKANNEWSLKRWSVIIIKKKIYIYIYIYIYMCMYNATHKHTDFNMINIFNFWTKIHFQILKVLS